MPKDNKVKIKLSELTDMYDIEDDTKDMENIPEKESKNEKDSIELRIEQEDANLEQEIDQEW